MKKSINVLIIDDHPMIINAYTTAIELSSDSINSYFFKIEKAVSIDEAISIINKVVSLKKFDLLLLDISLPKSNITNIHTGEDLGLYVKSKMPDVKILSITALNDTVRLMNIIKKLNPDGLLLKSDIDNKTLISAIDSVLTGHFYYSHSIIELLNNKITNRIVLDDLDIQLLIELSNGAKMKELQEFLPLTKSGLDKRKRLLREKLEIQSTSDRDLVIKAREIGFI